MIVTREGLPALPKKWVEKIQAGEFVDFTELPLANGKVRDTPRSVDGQIVHVVVQAADLVESRKLIPDFATWVQCFSIYVAVVFTKETECT